MHGSPKKRQALKGVVQPNLLANGLSLAVDASSPQRAARANLLGFRGHKKQTTLGRRPLGPDVPAPLYHSSCPGQQCRRHSCTRRLQDSTPSVLPACLLFGRLLPPHLVNIRATCNRPPDTTPHLRSCCRLDTLYTLDYGHGASVAYLTWRSQGIKATSNPQQHSSTTGIARTALALYSEYLEAP